MKSSTLQTKLFFLGVVVLMAVNGLVLSGVAYNRSGSPEAQIVLTEREIGLPYDSHSENNSLSLNLNWRIWVDKGESAYKNWDSPAWFDAEKLRKLGFSQQKQKQSGDLSRQKKEVFIVLDRDSPLFFDVLAAKAEKLAEQRQRLRVDPDNRVKQLQREFDREKESGSHLFAIDAGLNRQDLRRRYPDRQRYLLLGGVVGDHAWSGPGGRGTGSQWRGYIVRLNHTSIHVPRTQRLILETLTDGGKREAGPPRYRVTLLCGKKLEPWLAGIEALRVD